MLHVQHNKSSYIVVPRLPEIVVRCVGVSSGEEVRENLV